MKKFFDRIKGGEEFVVALSAALGLWLGFLVFISIGATTKPAEVRAHDPKPPVQSRELPDGIQRLYLDGHLYYWQLRSASTPILLHAAGCTNHPCAQTVLQLEK